MDKDAQKTTFRNNIILIISMVVIAGGILINITLHTLVRYHLMTTGWDREIINQIDREITLLSTGTTIVTSIGALIFAVILSNKITIPLKLLQEKMYDISAGNWDTRINLISDDEFGQLAEGFNFMASHIEESLNSVEAAKDYTETILMSMPSMLIVLSEKMNVLFKNEAFANLKDIYPALTVQQFIRHLDDAISECLEKGALKKKIITIVPEGHHSRLVFSAVVSRIHSDFCYKDEKATILLTLNDITEIRRMKELITRSRQDWEDTFNTIPDMITIHDRDFNIIQANRAAKENLSLPYIAIDKMNKCYSYFHGKDAPPEGCPSCNCYQTGKPVTFEIYEPHLDKHIEIRAIPRINASNEVIGLIHITRDISDRKKIEEEHNRLLNQVTKAKIEWEQTFDSTMEMIVIIDKDMNIKRCNRSFAEFVNSPIHEVAGSKCYQYFPCASSQRHDCAEKLKNPDHGFSKNEIQTENGRWLYVSHQPIKDDSSSTIQSVIVATDITELKNIQQQLSNSEAELKKKVDDLEKFYDLAVGRELRMKDLKKEIKKLNQKLMETKNSEIISG